MPRRRSLLTAGLLLAQPCATLFRAPPARAQGAAWPRRLTDLAGRTITLPRPARALLLATGFDLVALSLLHPDPASLLAGWVDDLKRINTALVDAFTARFPHLATVPLLGSAAQDSLSVEKALSLGADLALLPGWQAATPAGQALIHALEQAGIPSLVLDFTQDPLGATPASLRLLGQALGREEQAEAIARFHEARRDAILERVAASGQPGPRVLLHAFAGSESCCWVWNQSGLGSFVTRLGARNLGSDLLPAAGMGGMLHLETVLAEDPEVYITTGLPRYPVRLGPGLTREEARASLATVLQAPPLSGLSAIHAGRAHAVWNHFNTVPLNILAFEAMARWVRPGLFPDLDPADTLAEINQRFAAMPLEGAWWVSLKPGIP